MGNRQECNNYLRITLLSVPGKVLAHLLLMWVCSHLLKYQRAEQLGFIPGKSITNRILAHCVLMFDSVHCEALLRLRGIPAGIIGLLSGFHSGIEGAVKCKEGMSRFFPVYT